MGVPAVEVQHVTKHFRLYDERHTSLKDRLVHPGRSAGILVGLRSAGGAARHRRDTAGRRCGVLAGGALIGWGA